MQGLHGKDVDVIFACVGGGGLLAGVAAFIKAVRPHVKVVGVEAEDAAGTLIKSLFPQIIVYVYLSYP